MKRMRLFLLWSLGLIFTVSLHAQGGEVRRGERPVIDLERIPDEAMEAGKIRIWLDVSQQDILDNNPVYLNHKSQVVFSIPGVDDLNRQFGVAAAGQTFAMALVNKNYTSRHRKWGLHLWYDLEVPVDVSIREMVKRYSSLPEVAHAEPVYKKELIGYDENAFELYVPDKQYSSPNDPQFSSQWHYHNTGQQEGTVGADISLTDAWEIQRGSPDVVIAVIDGGIAISHPDLAGNMWPGNGFNFVNNTPNIEPHNHGAHVAGTIAAMNNNNIGVSGVAGGWGETPGVSLMSLQVFAANSNGGFAVAPVWGADNGAAISQNSWGYTSQNAYEQAVLDAIDYFNANAGGTVMEGGLTIFAAGNGNSSGNWYPGIYSGAMAVAATNNQDKKSWYSNYGSWVEISAPGGETNTVTQRGVLSTITGNDYAFYQGTSMACPHVTGVAALLLSEHPGEFTPDELRMILIHSADDHYAVNPSFVGQLGSGRLNALSALQMAPVFLLMPKTPENFTATTAGTTQIDITWNLNDANDEILLVFSQDPTMGSPESGQTYSPGEVIPGGGTVLATGVVSSFEHTGLEPGDYYYYRIWSKNGDGLYSLPSAVQLAITDCELFDELPFVETFPVNMTPACWHVIDNQGNGQVWKFGTFSSGLQDTSGNYAYLNSDGYGSGNSQNSDLLSPVFDLSDYAEVTLEFSHFYRSYSNSAGTLFLSVDGGTTWEQLQQWTATTPNPSHVEIDLESAAGSPAVQLKWNYTGSYGYYWCIDDVELNGVLSIPGAPAIVTLPASNIDFQTATLNAELADVGDNAVFASGFVLSINPNPVMGEPGVIVFDTGAQSGTGQITFDVTGLESANRYYFRAWAENNTALVYGGQMSFATPCDVFNLPFAESFDEAAIPYCWEVVDNIGAGQVWTVGSFSGGLQNSSGNYAYLNSDGFGSGNTQNSDLISPLINLGGATSVEISFIHYFRSYSSSAGTFYYSLDGGSNWVQAAQWTGSNTSNPDSFSLELSDLSAQQQLMLKWNYTGTWGYSWNIDDVLVAPLDVTYNELQISISGNGTTVPEAGTYQYIQGEEVSVEAFASEGWEFDKWIIDENQQVYNPQLQVTVDSDKQLVAHFTEIIIPEYSLIISVEGQGTTTPGAGEHIYQEGEVAELMAEAPEGWQFLHWAINDNEQVESASHSLVMDSDHLALAVFVEIIPEYVVVIDVEGEGTSNPGPGQYEIEEGTNLELLATAAEDWIFYKWVINGQDIAENPYQIMVADDLNITAVFSTQVSVDKMAEMPGVIVFPNPVIDKLNVQLSSGHGLVEIVLTDIHGRGMIRQTIESSEQMTATILEVQGLPRGIYFLRLNSVTGVFVKKIMLQ